VFLAEKRLTRLVGLGGTRGATLILKPIEEVQ